MIVTFTGDICISGNFVDKIENDTPIFSKGVLTALNQANFVVANLESPVTNSKKYINFNTPLKSPTNTIKYLSKRNITIFNLANNHILDYTDIGLHDTLKEIKKNNCNSFGAGFSNKEITSPVILEKDNIKIALFGIAKTNPYQYKKAKVFYSENIKLLKKVIKKTRLEVNFIVVNFHGGEEYSQFPSPVKRKFLKKIAKLKEVDCIVAHHSHTLQGVEIFKETPIFYSLGNFIFDIPNHKYHNNTDFGALLQLQFSKKKITFSFLPYNIQQGFVTDFDNVNFQKQIDKLSNFSDYSKKWQKEAYNNLFLRKKINEAPKHTIKPLQEKAFLSILFSKEFYKKIRLILSDQYMFSLYTSAIYFKLKNKL